MRSLLSVGPQRWLMLFSGFILWGLGPVLFVRANFAWPDLPGRREAVQSELWRAELYDTNRQARIPRLPEPKKDGRKA